MTTDTQRTAWAEHIRQECLREAGNDTEAGALAAEYILSVCADPIPSRSLSIFLAHDTADPRAQGVLDQALNAARDLSASARKELEAALGLTGNPGGAAILKLISKYREQLAELLGAAGLAALVEGAHGVAIKVPRLDADAAAVSKLVGGIPMPSFPQGDDGPALSVAGAIKSLFSMIREAVRGLFTRNVVTKTDYNALDHAARAKAFTVANVDAEDTLTKIRDALAKNVQNGADHAAFREAVLDAVESGTFMSDAHLETVFRTNVQTAYSDGQMTVLQNPLVRDGFPYAAYDAIHDDRVRHEHLELEKHGIDGSNVYRTDDPVFQTFRPPWSWNCRCSWTPLTVRHASEMGIAEAKRWLASGAEPTPPAHVPMPAFAPPEGFTRAFSTAPASVRLSMQSMIAFSKDAQGYEHRGSGPGGGQFTGTGGGGSSNKSEGKPNRNRSRAKRIAKKLSPETVRKVKKKAKVVSKRLVEEHGPEKAKKIAERKVTEAAQRIKEFKRRINPLASKEEYHKGLRRWFTYFYIMVAIDLVRKSLFGQHTGEQTTGESFSQDEGGREHKGKGEGGGQFVSKGGGEDGMGKNRTKGKDTRRNKTRVGNAAIRFTDNARPGARKIVKWMEKGGPHVPGVVLDSIKEIIISAKRPPATQSLLSRLNPFGTNRAVADANRDRIVLYQREVEHRLHDIGKGDKYLAGVVMHRWAQNKGRATPKAFQQYWEAQKTEQPVRSTYEPRSGGAVGEPHPADDFADACKMYVQSPSKLEKQFPRKYAALHSIFSDQSAAFAQDVQGHQHRGKGPGGGQFTSTGGGSSGGSSRISETKGKSKPGGTSSVKHTERFGKVNTISGRTLRKTSEGLLHRLIMAPFRTLEKTTAIAKEAILVLGRTAGRATDALLNVDPKDLAKKMDEGIKTGWEKLKAGARGLRGGAAALDTKLADIAEWAVNWRAVRRVKRLLRRKSVQIGSVKLPGMETREKSRAIKIGEVTVSWEDGGKNKGPAMHRAAKWLNRIIQNDDRFLKGPAKRMHFSTNIEGIKNIRDDDGVVIGRIIGLRKPTSHDKSLSISQEDHPRDKSNRFIDKFAIAEAARNPEVAAKLRESIPEAERPKLDRAIDHLQTGGTVHHPSEPYGLGVDMDGNIPDPQWVTYAILKEVHETWKDRDETRAKRRETTEKAVKELRKRNADLDAVDSLLNGGANDADQRAISRLRHMLKRDAIALDSLINQYEEIAERIHARLDEEYREDKEPDVPEEPNGQSAAFGMVGNEWHGPNPPGDGWTQIQPGPRGGMRWRKVDEQHGGGTNGVGTGSRADAGQPSPTSGDVASAPAGPSHSQPGRIRKGRGQPTGAPVAKDESTIDTAELDRVNKRIDKYTAIFRARKQDDAADWLDLLRNHVNTVGVSTALRSLEEIPTAGNEGHAQYQSTATFGDSPDTQFLKRYLDHTGITLIGQDQTRAPKERLVTAAPVKSAREQERPGDIVATETNLADKLEESKYLPGLESTEDLDKIAGVESDPNGASAVKRFTPDLITALDEKYGKDKWIVKSYGDEAYAGFGIFFPQRVRAIHESSVQTIWNAEKRLLKHGYALARDENNAIIGLQDTKGNVYHFGTQAYSSIGNKFVRRLGREVRAAAASEKGVRLPGSPEEFLKQNYGMLLHQDDQGEVVALTLPDGQRIPITLNKGSDGTVWGVGSSPEYDKLKTTADEDDGGQMTHEIDRAVAAVYNPAQRVRFMAQPAFEAVGVTEAERAVGLTWETSYEGRVHVTVKDGKASVVPYATIAHRGDYLPAVFKDDDIRAMERAAQEAIDALPESERNGQVYAPDVVKTKDGWRVVEVNASSSEGSSLWLEENPFVIDAYVGHVTDREPNHVRFMKETLRGRMGLTKLWPGAARKHTAKPNAPKPGQNVPKHVPHSPKTGVPEPAPIVTKGAGV